MNKKNAQKQGRERGARYLRNHGTPEMSKESYMDEGLLISRYEIRDLQVEHIFMCGWEESWSPPKRKYPHNPNSRFCACEKCMAE
jgi:hypothetical protein